MNKLAVGGGVVALIVILGAGVAALQHNKKDTSDSSMKNMSTSTSKSSDSSASTSTSGSGADSSGDSSNGKDGPALSDSKAFPTSINNFAFADQNITVKKGTTVTWTNKDSATHTVTESDGQTGPDSGDLASGKAYSYTFNTVGTFKYHCAIHPSMTGTVTVTE